MRRFCVITLLIFLTSISMVEAMNPSVVIADSTTHEPLSYISILNNKGIVIGKTDSKGFLPSFPSFQYPLTVRSIGYKERQVWKNTTDTVFLSEQIAELPEVVVESRKYPLLHLLAYVREYSTLTTYRDTIFLFREKMVDYMIPQDGKVNFKGWKTPRILSSKSYYRYTNQAGLDSVSDECMYHFSWSDWIGLPPQVTMPMSLSRNVTSTDTLHGKYSPVEVWERTNDNIGIHVNLLADTIGRKWLPSLSGFLKTGVDYDKFKVNYNYKNVIGEELSIRDLDCYSYSIESTGRGHNMFRFNRKDEPYYVTTDAEIYIIDKEYVTVKEAKKWDNRHFDFDKIGILQSMDAPPISTHIKDLMARVENIDKKEIRLNMKPDKRIGYSTGMPSMTVGQKALSFIKKLLKL